MSADIKAHSERIRRMAEYTAGKFTQAGLTLPQSLQRLPDDIHAVFEIAKELRDMVADCKVFKDKPSDQAVSDILDTFGKLAKALSDLDIWLIYWRHHAEQHDSFAGFKPEEIKDTHDFIKSNLGPIIADVIRGVSRCACMGRRRG